MDDVQKQLLKENVILYPETLLLSGFTAYLETWLIVFLLIFTYRRIRIWSLRYTLPRLWRYYQMRSTIQALLTPVVTCMSDYIQGLDW
jgi:hypothetical protein